MNKQEFIAKYVDEELECGHIQDYVVSEKKMISQIAAMKKWLRLNDQDRPEWLSVNLVDEIITAINCEIKNRLDY